MKHTFSTDFNLESRPGTVDIALRYDTVTGHYNYRVEECGLPASVPMHVFNGILFSILQQACAGMIQGYRPPEETSS